MRRFSWVPVLGFAALHCAWATPGSDAPVGVGSHAWLRHAYAPQRWRRVHESRHNGLGDEVSEGRTLYVTDLDGTLLSGRGRLEADHARRLKRLVRDRGLLLTYATARSHLMAQRVTGAGWGTAAVVYNGAFTVEPDGGRVLRRHVLDEGVVRQVLAGAQAHGLAPLVFDYDGTDHVQWVRGQETPGVTRYLSDRAGDRRFDPRPEWSALRTAAVFYVAVIGTRNVVDELALELGGSIGSSCTVNVQQDTYHPQDTWLEITPPGVTKASEVLALADMLDAGRVVCFGDNQNDLSLFEVADEAYAVGNATPQVLARATSVIGTNEEGGVVAWLERHGH